ncbi:tetratricopeptide repeat protein [Wenyingzhuangia sp. IMCC45574]
MKKTFFLFLFVTSLCFSQQMQKGFNFLETGQYAKAEVFFSKILTDFPKNKTAKLCYGRAVGLNGKPNKAVTIFTEMLSDYPNDFEIELNYAESLLWSNQFEKAEKFYEALIQKNDQSFAALLGYANTFSNLKKYDNALDYVNKALEVIPGNPNAMVSKKYIYLGMANQQVQNQEYDEAIENLLKDLELFPNDKDILLNLGNTYIIAKKYTSATDVYNNMQQDTTLYFTAKNNLSLIAHLQDKNKMALEISKQTLAEITPNSTPKDTKNTQERYAQALIWNGKYKDAKKFIDKISEGKEPQSWILGLQATLYTYTGDFKNSLTKYDQILDKDIASFDGNLGKANALKANNRIKEALNAANTTLTHFPNQKDAVNFIKTIKTSFTPILNTKASHSYDIGESKNNTYELSLTLPVSIKTSILTSFNQKNATNNRTNNESTSETMNFGLSYQLHSKINVTGTIGTNRVQGSNNGEKTEYDQATALVLFKTTPFKRQNLDIGYKRETQNFNAELLNKEIVLNDVFLNYNLNTTFNLGWFTQYFYTFQSDQNKRHLLFTSLYYNLLKKPAIKTGMNFQYITYAEQKPTTYFSPSAFKSVELFVNLIKDKLSAKNNTLFYGITAAYGYQYIEKNPKISAYRAQANLGYKFNDYALLDTYYSFSNIAAAAVNPNDVGFEYTEFGLKFTWRFLEKPLFKSLQ